MQQISSAAQTQPGEESNTTRSLQAFQCQPRVEIKTNTSDNHGGGGPELSAPLTGFATDRLKNKRRTKKAIKILYKGEDFNPATLKMNPQYSAAHLVLLLKKLVIRRIRDAQENG